jgi:hypothetical protein
MAKAEPSWKGSQAGQAYWRAMGQTRMGLGVSIFSRVAAYAMMRETRTELRG